MTKRLGTWLFLFLTLICTGCAASLPMPRYSKVLNAPLDLRNKSVAVLYFDSSNAQVVAGARNQEQVDELKKTAGTMLAESIALKARARLNTRVDAVGEAPSDAQYLIVTARAN